MQTFLPHADFARSAAALDRQRLGKQRVEVLQLLNTFRPDRRLRGWANHPARLQWEGYLDALARYGLVVCAEWVHRGYRDGCAAKIAASWCRSTAREIPGGEDAVPPPMLEEIGTFLRQREEAARRGEDSRFFPPWFGDERYHASHRGNLLRKDPVWYGTLGWTESPELPYFWPVSASP